MGESLGDQISYGRPYRLEGQCLHLHGARMHAIKEMVLQVMLAPHLVSIAPDSTSYSIPQNLLHIRDPTS